MSKQEEILEQTLNEYKNQLSVVISALIENQTQDLIELKNKLEEIIAFTEVDLISVKKERLLSEINSDKYKFIVNNEESDRDPKPSTSSSNDKRFMESLNELNGNECRAPFGEQNGSVNYHNAVIMINESINDCSDPDMNEIKVKVFFTYPLSNSMLSCPYYLNGKCKYSDTKCKFSHGYYVCLSHIKPFKEINFSHLSRDSLCLAKSKSDPLWYKAIVDNFLNDDKVVVKYVDYDVIDTIDIEDLLPLNSDESEDCDNNIESKINDNCDETQSDGPIIAWNSSSYDSGMAEWEIHTKGIGSKLMAKMGYVWGRGLGKYGEGIIQPIEATVFPAGKSLDVCMRLKEKNSLKDPFKVNIKLKAKKLSIAAKIAEGYHRVNDKESLFEFINNKVFTPKINSSKIDSNVSESMSLSASQLKTSNTQTLNISSLKASEDLRKAEFELKRLNASIDRNKTKDKVILSQLQEKVNKQNYLIKSLREREAIILKEQKFRSNKQKLSIF